MMTCPKSADVVIIGGGPAGAAALWALNRLQPHISVVLLEKGKQPGSGSSTASLENYRSCWPILPIAKQMQRSLEVFSNPDDWLGDGAAQALHIKQQGYLFFAFNEQQAMAFKHDVQRLHSIGLTHIEYLEANELNARFEWMNSRVIGAKYDPHAGWLDSNALIHRYIQSARQNPNVHILLDVPEVSIRVEGGQVKGVRTPSGTIDTPHVLIAAGAGSHKVGRTAGIDLPIILRPRQSFTTPWRHETFPHDAPMLIANGPHVRPEARDGAIFGWEYGWRAKNHAGLDRYKFNATRDALIDPVDNLNQLKDPRFPSMVLLLLARRFGHEMGDRFANPRYLRGVSHNIGYYVFRDKRAAYKVAADGTQHGYHSERALIDKHPDVKGLFVSVAHVGHGIMTSPAAGEIAAAHILGQPLPHPAFSDFGFAAHWVDYDESVL